MFYLHHKQGEGDDIVLWAGTFSRQDPAHSWKAGPGKQTYKLGCKEL